MLELRPDRLATLYFFHPVRRALSLTASGIPILMYHSISELDESAKRPYYRIGTNPPVFEEQLRFLHASGYESVGLQEAVGVMEGALRVPEKPVVLTFDDGYQDFYTEAFPLLSRFGYSATVFLPTAYIADTTRTFNGIECLTWGQVRELHQAGIRFGSHTVTHPRLRILDREKVVEEVRHSKETIEQEVGSRVTSFSYPYAFPETDRTFVPMLRRILEETGYENGVSTSVGTVDGGRERFFMSRLPVNALDDARLLSAKLAGSYNWVHMLQCASKLLKPTTYLPRSPKTQGINKC